MLIGVFGWMRLTRKGGIVMTNNHFGPYGLSEEQEKERLLNLATVDTFFTLEGPERHAKRKALYANDGRFELSFDGPDPNNPSFWYCPNQVDEHSVETSTAENKVFPDWGFHDIRIYSTDDPQMVFAYCVGAGMRFDPRLPEPYYYENTYFLEFILENGKIKVLKELFNPFNCLRPSGHDEVPGMFI